MNKKCRAAAVILALTLPAGAGAMEFQTPGAVGIGGAGVARATDARAVYWNPGGLAFPEKNFSSRLNLGTGISINSSLAANVDKIGKMDVNELKNLQFSYDPNTLNTATNLNVTAQAAEYIGVVNDLEKNQGTLIASPGGMLAFQYSGIGVAAIMSSELISIPYPTDTINVRPGDASVTTVKTFGQGIGAIAIPTPPINAVTPPVGNLFTAEQRINIGNAFYNKGNNGVTPEEASAIVATLEGQLQSSGGNKSQQTSQQLEEALILMANSFSNGGKSIESNGTSVYLKGFALVEIPIAYGHKFDLGGFGKFGLGAALKIMQGTTSSTTKQLITLNNSSDIFKDIKNNKSESTTYGIDLGAHWRLEEVPVVGPLNVGFVYKNINSPEFDVTPDASFMTSKMKVKPQARVGIAVDPLSWITIAADMDLTKNKTVLPNVESQNLGGGVELHWAYAAFRGGVYKNMTDSAYKPVVTGGISLGPDWLRLDVDAAVSTEKTQYDNKSYPREAKVDFALSTMF